MKRSEAIEQAKALETQADTFDAQANAAMSDGFARKLQQVAQDARKLAISWRQLAAVLK